MLFALSLLVAAGVLAVFAPALAEWARPQDQHALPIAAAYTEDQHRGPATFRTWKNAPTADFDASERALLGLAPVQATTDVTIPAETHLRTFYGERQVWLEPGVSVQDWLYGASVVALADVSLAGSVEAADVLTLLGPARFERLHAPTVRFGPAADAPEAPFPLALHETAATHSLRPLVAGSVNVPDGALVDDDLIATGDLTLGAGSRVRGSVKAGGRLLLGRGAVVEGHAVAVGDLMLGTNARVHGVAASEADVYAASSARVGLPDAPATLTGEHVHISPGVTVHGTVWARVDGVYDAATA